MDGIELEIMWGNMISIVSEQAKALQRTAFSPIVREAGDLATAIFDADARMVAQGLAGTPGHINSLAAAAKNLITIIPPDTIFPGDVLITNDPGRFEEFEQRFTAEETAQGVTLPGQHDELDIGLHRSQLALGLSHEREP